MVVIQGVTEEATDAVGNERIALASVAVIILFPSSQID